VQRPKPSLSIFKSVPAKSKRERNNVDKDNRNLPLGAKFHYTLEIYVINNKKKKKERKKEKEKTPLAALSMWRSTNSIIGVIPNRALVGGIHDNIESRA